MQIPCVQCYCPGNSTLIVLARDLMSQLPGQSGRFGPTAHCDSLRHDDTVVLNRRTTNSPYFIETFRYALFSASANVSSREALHVFNERIYTDCELMVFLIAVLLLQIL